MNSLGASGGDYVNKSQCVPNTLVLFDEKNSICSIVLRQDKVTTVGIRIAKQQLLDEQKHQCFYCHFHVTIPVETLGPRQCDATIDHLIPREYNGGNDKANLVVACRFCNDVRLHFRDYRLYQRVICEILKNDIIWQKWHRFSKAELRIMRRMIREHLAKLDREWAHEVTERRILSHPRY